MQARLDPTSTQRNLIDNKQTTMHDVHEKAEIYCFRRVSAEKSIRDLKRSR